ncbi:hypothetical protein COV49_02820 [Candidatus Falkowbacteria bacterium CG11_big_fil_rev_8_21_14_0_20_39_10]|uniref:Transposase IS200-like domain-containing protein n=1 Tax=Candidatus Falkowbacteria bacterium CG11_big_fil_rev_8_21_14_0_20_39_10 TaxID=1974570 RepID=A0A2M6K910_9BACT|nr:MAG: hypothetical protein COV49_02820 [Candidatus Falkowbacteria bacterium CG11_big_fil_rev_8_21_14_0_20_39_10]
MSRIFQSGYYYHIYNRGVDKREIFQDQWDYVRFIKSIRVFNNIRPSGSVYLQDKLKSSPNPSKDSDCLIEIIAYSLLPNHFHFLVKQLKDNGISKFMQKLGMGYTNYFNYKHGRSGYLFQGKFKSKRIKSHEHLCYVSSYVNGNIEIHKVAIAKSWPWSSYQDYLGIRNGTLCDKESVLNDLKSVFEYERFTNYVINNSSKIKEEIKKYFIE